MSFLFPVGGLIGSRDTVRSRSQTEYDRVPSDRAFTSGIAERDVGVARFHQPLQGNQGGIEPPVLRSRTFTKSELSENSPKLLLWGNGTRALEEPAAGGLAFLESLIGVVEAPADWAAEHDHYLYGSPRRYE
jgi:hypothetical protein